MSDSTDPFDKLEEKLIKVLELFKRTREEKRALERELGELGGDSKEHAKVVQTLEKEITALRREREDVRQRIERLLERIDALTGSDSGG